MKKNYLTPELNEEELDLIDPVLASGVNYSEETAGFNDVQKVL